jgi:hypothetical protein
VGIEPFRGYPIEDFNEKRIKEGQRASFFDARREKKPPIRLEALLKG